MVTGHGFHTDYSNRFCPSVGDNTLCPFRPCHRRQTHLPPLTLSPPALCFHTLAAASSDATSLVLSTSSALLIVLRRSSLSSTSCNASFALCPPELTCRESFPLLHY